MPLDLSSDEIFQKKPPFIWFTGHRDFKLTEKEVANLGEYLRRGGCIWTKRPNKVHPDLTAGCSATIAMTPQAIRDLKSVASFVEVKSQK